MTLSESELHIIQNMSAVELRETIAIEKGCRWYQVRSFAYLADINGRMLIDRDAVYVDSPDVDKQRLYMTPDWPDSVSAAWELVEEIRKAHTYLEISVNIDGWACQALPSPSSDFWAFNVYGAETAPLAICRAWLLWVEKEEKQNV